MEQDFHTVRGYELQSYNKKLLTSAMEDYLEMIYRNSLNVGYIRINKLAQLLNVKDSSASKMVQKLGKLELLNYEKYGVITLTEKGRKIGEVLLKKHNIIQSFLSFLNCSKEALIETELIEHVISDETVRNMYILYSFFNSNEEILQKYMNFKKEF